MKEPHYAHLLGHLAECIDVHWHNADFHSALCHNAECHHTDCDGVYVLVEGHDNLKLLSNGKKIAEVVPICLKKYSRYFRKPF